MAANFSVSEGASKSVPQLNPPLPSSNAPASATSTPRITVCSSARLAYELNLARVLVLSRKSVPTDRRLTRSPPGVSAAAP